MTPLFQPPGSKLCGQTCVAMIADVSLTQGVLEGSNVNTFAAMTEMIELERNFELQTKVMKNVDDNSGASARLTQMA